MRAKFKIKKGGNRKKNLGGFEGRLCFERLDSAHWRDVTPPDKRKCVSGSDIRDPSHKMGERALEMEDLCCVQQESDDVC